MHRQYPGIELEIPQPQLQTQPYSSFIIVLVVKSMQFTILPVCVLMMGSHAAPPIDTSLARKPKPRNSNESDN
jgi:hypothetical protein